jgi:ABC-type lipoprotein export system ATPase subunit
MKIELRKIVPLSFVPSASHENAIWNAEITFCSPEKYLIVAPSGTGKSSLAGFLYGLRKDFSGEILFDELPSHKMELNAWSLFRRDKLSVVFQDLRLFELLTVDENLRLKFNLGSEFKEEEIEYYADELGIADLLPRKVNTLSMGQKQRVAILRALIQPFRFILMDEPFSHLDSENTGKALRIINAVCEKQNAGFILTSLGATYNFDPSKILYL